VLIPYVQEKSEPEFASVLPGYMDSFGHHEKRVGIHSRSSRLLHAFHSLNLPGDARFLSFVSLISILPTFKTEIRSNLRCDAH
jgi:hypothetical protein